jgi:hypothetical protein
LNLLHFFVGVVLLVVFLVLPVKVAAHVVSARRTTFGACLLAVIVAIVIQVVAARLIHYGDILSVLLAAVAYMAVLDTSYLRGIAIAVLQIVFTFLFTIVLALLGLAVLLPAIWHGVVPTLPHHATWV